MKRLETFGKIEFSDFKSGKRGRPTRIYNLNEPQATLLITFLDNTDIVADFKTELVRQFYSMKKFIFERQTKSWEETRRIGKLTRKSETDTIKKLIEYAKEQGSTHSDKLYMTYSKLANKMAGITSREEATITQLNNLCMMENIILNVIEAGLEANKNYKQIYKDCKERIQMVSRLAYLN